MGGALSWRANLIRVPVTLRPEIAVLAPYRQGRPAPADAFKLSSNESPFPPLPSVLEAIGAAHINRYPDGAATALRVRLAERSGVTVDEVHVGAGSVSILHQLVQAAAGIGDEVLYAWRSFEAYPGLVTVAGATSVTVPEPAGRPPRPRRHGRRPHRSHPRRHRLHAEQPDQHDRDRARVRGLHGEGARHGPGGARRGVPRVRHGPARGGRAPTARALPQPGRAAHLLEGVRPGRAPDRLRGRAVVHPRGRARHHDRRCR